MRRGRRRPVSYRPLRGKTTGPIEACYDCGGAQVGPATRAVWAAYWDLRYDPKLSFAVDYIES